MSGLWRAGLITGAILVALVLGRLTTPEPVPRIERVKERVMIQVPAPVQAPAPRRRATLEDVRKDWQIEGRLSCVVVQR